MIFREIDIESIYEIKILKDLEKECFGNGGIDEWVLRPFARYGKIIVLENNGEIISFAELFKIWDENAAYLYSFGTKKSYQRNGFGKKLLEYIIDYCKNSSIEKIKLTVAHENDSALCLYKSLGFKKIKNLENEYGIGIHRCLMEIIL